MTPFVAELIGTMLLILLGDGVVANMLLKGTKGNGGGIISIATAWALAVFVGVVVAGPYSGAHLNPAITFGFAISGMFPWCDVIPYIVAQLAGAMLGALLVWMFYHDHFAISDDPGAKLAIFCTGPAIRNIPRNFFCELIGTFVLMFGVYYIAGGSFVDASTSTEVPIGLGSLGAIPVAFIVWVIGLSLGGTTGYAINPARDLGPRIMHQILPIAGKGGSDWGYSWVPVIAPLAGAAFATLIYWWVGLYA
ncbi:MAG: MIP/aquaporin family protein [Marinifilaceae bacterium]